MRHSRSRHRSNIANVPAREYQQAFVVVVNAEGCSDIGQAPLKLQHSLSLSIIL
jgi:hypothetical protein